MDSPTQSFGLRINRITPTWTPPNAEPRFVVELESASGKSPRAVVTNLGELCDKKSFAAALGEQLGLSIECRSDRSWHQQIARLALTELGTINQAKFGESCPEVRISS